jgi:mannose-6-phosphate isomerase-like protein (cupin superfamily)
MSKLNASVQPEIFDVFQVSQLTRGTSLEDSVAVDDVTIRPDQSSKIHRHVQSDTVLYMVEGKGEIIIDDQIIPVAIGDRVHIRPGQFHGVRTGGHSLHFISIQMPPILNRKTGVLDLEER